MISTACERFSEGWILLLWILSRKPHRSTSSLLSPFASLPKRIATLLFAATSRILAVPCSTGSTTPRLFPSLLVVPTTTALSLIASSTVSWISAESSTSWALRANHLPSSDISGGGLTRQRFLNPMFFIARADEPILPGSLGSTSTKNMFCFHVFISGCNLYHFNYFGKSGLQEKTELMDYLIALKTPLCN